VTVIDRGGMVVFQAGKGLEREDEGRKPSKGGYWRTARRPQTVRRTKRSRDGPALALLDEKKVKDGAGGEAQKG